MKPRTSRASGRAPPSSSRYLTVGVVFLLLMLVEAARGWKIRRWVPFVVLLLAWVSFGKADGGAEAGDEWAAKEAEASLPLSPPEPT